MSILYLEEHTSCGNYISDYNIGFKYYPIQKDEYFTSSNKKFNCLFFLLNGSVKFSLGSQEYILKKNHVCFIPVSSEYEIKAITDACFVINYFNKPVDLCERLALENLTPYIKDQKTATSILKINQPLKTFLSSLIYYLKAGVACKHFHEIKQKELFFILRFFYSKKEIAYFFAPIISNDLDFKNTVLSNYLRSNSVKELATSCNYSLSSFNRTFKKNFQENPYIWLQNQKLKYITSKLLDKNTPINQIADEFGFSSPGHLTTFCKKHLQLTPTQFRKQNTK